MNTDNQQENPVLDENSSSWEDVEEERSQECVDHEKDTFIKHIRLDLFLCQTYCPVDKMAKAIGGEFTGEFVTEICQDKKWPVKQFERRGKSYVEIEPFLEKLKAGLIFEDAPCQCER